MVPIVVLIFWMGLRPSFFMAHSTRQVLALVQGSGAPAARTPRFILPVGAPAHEAPAHPAAEAHR